MTSYALANAWDQAHHRLTLLAQHQDPVSQRRLTALGVAQGWHCLEVGGGLGSVAQWLSQQVGITGHVTVTDIDTRFLEAIDQPNVEVCCHDITAEDLPQGQFDLVYSRWLLYHLPHPEQAVARMVAALRPGGWLLLEDVDFFPLRAFTSPVYVDFMTALAATVGSAAGHDGFWAAHALPALVDDEDLDEIGGEADLTVVSGGTPFAEFWQLTGRQMRDRVLSSGALSAEQYDMALALLDNPTFRTFSNAGIAAWGRRRNERSAPDF